MGIQNLRNKYRNHPVIKPLIEHCEEHQIGFELVKETRQVIFGIKSFRYINNYYMKIENNLIKTDKEFLCWSDLFKLITKAYEHLGLEYPENLIRASKVFNKH